MSGMCLSNGGPVFDVGQMFCTKTAGHDGLHKVKYTNGVEYEWSTAELVGAIERVEMTWRREHSLDDPIDKVRRILEGVPAGASCDQLVRAVASIRRAVGG